MSGAAGDRSRSWNCSKHLGFGPRLPRSYSHKHGTFSNQSIFKYKRNSQNSTCSEFGRRAFKKPASQSSLCEEQCRDDMQPLWSFGNYHLLYMDSNETGRSSNRAYWSADSEHTDIHTG